MKLKYEFEYIEIGDEINAVPVGDSAEKFHGIVRTSESAREIMKMLEKENDEDSIVKSLSEKYTGSSKNEIGEHVHTFLQELKDAGLVEL